MNEQQLFEHYFATDPLMAFIVLSRIGCDRPVNYTWNALMRRTKLEWSAK